jgi:hypothetical protein
MIIISKHVVYYYLVVYNCQTSIISATAFTVRVLILVNISLFSIVYLLCLIKKIIFICVFSLHRVLIEKYIYIWLVLNGWKNIKILNHCTLQLFIIFETILYCFYIEQLFNMKYLCLMRSINRCRLMTRIILSFFLFNF